MGFHVKHNMQITSLYSYFGNWDYKRFNELFRQETEKKILYFHYQHKEFGLTDNELMDLFGSNIDSNIVRPRRADLTREKRNIHGEMARPSFLYDSGTTRKNKLGINVIVWKLQPENLRSYCQ